MAPTSQKTTAADQTGVVAGDRRRTWAVASYGGARSLQLPGPLQCREGGARCAGAIAGKLVGTRLGGDMRWRLSTGEIEPAAAACPAKRAGLLCGDAAAVIIATSPKNAH